MLLPCLRHILNPNLFLLKLQSQEECPEDNALRPPSVLVRHNQGLAWNRSHQWPFTNCLLHVIVHCLILSTSEWLKDFLVSPSGFKRAILCQILHFLDLELHWLPFNWYWQYSLNKSALRMASPAQWTWVWANSRRQWRTRAAWRGSVHGLQRVEHNWVTKQQGIQKDATLCWAPLDNTRNKLRQAFNLGEFFF